MSMVKQNTQKYTPSIKTFFLGDYIVLSISLVAEVRYRPLRCLHTTVIGIDNIALKFLKISSIYK